jgi:hypothetical protein
MINEETPDKLAEIIRDTWPGLFMRPKKDDEKEGLARRGGVESDRNVRREP